jgi:heme exporter protein D
MSEFLAMGGYAFYVWGAYGVAAFVVAGEIVSVRAKRRAVLAEARVAGAAEAAR